MVVTGDPIQVRFFNQGEQRQVTLATDPVTIDCLSLPEQGKPADFSGVIGNFNMTATAGPTNAMVGDPVELRARSAAKALFDAARCRRGKAWHDFKLYPPTTKTEMGDQFGFQGTKTFEQIVTPLNADVHELPAVTFSFFNPDQGRHVTLTQPAVPLAVHPSGSAPLPAHGGQNATPENQSPADIMPIKENLGALVV